MWNGFGAGAGTDRSAADLALSGQLELAVSAAPLLAAAAAIVDSGQ